MAETLAPSQEKEDVKKGDEESLFKYPGLNLPPIPGINPIVINNNTATNIQGPPQLITSVTQCSCTQGDAAGLNASLQGTIDNLAKNLGDKLSAYVENVTNSVPDYIKQYIDNPAKASARAILEAKNIPASGAKIVSGDSWSQQFYAEHAFSATRGYQGAAQAIFSAGGKSVAISGNRGTAISQF